MREIVYDFDDLSFRHTHTKLKFYISSLKNKRSKIGLEKVHLFKKINNWISQEFILRGKT